MEIDSKSAIKYINKVYKLKIENPELQDFSVNIYGNKIFKDPLKQRNIDYIIIMNIKNGNFNPSRDTNINRFHSNLTRLRRELRNYLTYKGEKLINIDLSNSQPFISLFLFNPKNYKGDALLKQKIDKEKSCKEKKGKVVNNYINSPYSTTITSPYTMVGEISVSHINKRIQRYIDLVVSGKLYSYLQEEFNKRLEEPIDDYRELKQVIFLLYYSKNGFYYQKGALHKRIFDELFPEVYNVFYKIKKEDQNALSNLLQRKESNIFIDKICNRIAIEYPEAPIDTIHDSVTTTYKYQDKVQKIMEEELKFSIGYQPSFKLDYWLPKYASKSIEKLKFRSNNM